METQNNNNNSQNKIQTNEITQEDRIRGSLYGLAWGDVFGCPVEGWREGDIRHIYKDYPELVEDYDFDKISSIKKSKHIKKLRPIGLHSDDTQQCLALLNCCISSLKEDIDNYKRIGRKRTEENPAWRSLWITFLKEGMTSKAFRGYGRNFSDSIRNLKKGVSIYESGTHSSGMGAAMRIGPLGALYRTSSRQQQQKLGIVPPEMDDVMKEMLATVAYESSLITHGTILAGSLSFAVAAAVSGFVNGFSAEQVRAWLPGVVAQEEKKWIVEKDDWKILRENSHLLSQGLRIILQESQELWSDRTKLRHFISDYAKSHLADGFTIAHCNQGFACLGGLHGLVMALLPDIDPQQILSEIVVLGYDTDTVAAICGSILGARFGCSWIPCHRFLDMQRLSRYADALVTQNPIELEDRREYMAIEAAWTATEKKYRNANIAKYAVTKKRKEKKKKAITSKDSTEEEHLARESDDDADADQDEGEQHSTTSSFSLLQEELC